MERKQRINDWFQEYKSHLECEICGEDRTSCLDFHHVGEKKENIGNMALHGFSVESILKEIEKCIVVCANCHRMIHSNE